MKTIVYYLVCTAIILCAMPLFASDTMDYEDSLRKFYAGYGSPRFSGKGTYIRTLYKKAVDVNDLLEGKDFKDEGAKQRYLRHLRSRNQLTMGLKQDKNIYTLERLYFDGHKKRRDYLSLSPAVVENIRNDPNVIASLSLNVMAFDGSKSISLTSSQMPDGTTRNYADIMPHGRIYCPKFHQFGRGAESARDFNLQTFIDLIDRGLATFKQSSTNGQVHSTLEMGLETGPSFKMERIFDPDKGMSILYTALSYDNQLSREIICQDYEQTSSGAWYPRKYIDNKYVYVKGERLLTSSETLEAIPGTVNFNIPIESSIFSPELPTGTNVIDERHSPPLEYTFEGALPVKPEDTR